MRLIVSNPSSDEITYIDGEVVIPAYGSLTISSTYWFSLYDDPQFISDIRLNNIQINDGNNDLPHEEAEAYIEKLNVFNYNNKDIDGAVIVRTKAAKKGWSFWACPPEITTSTIGGTLYCKDASGTDIPGITCKIYNGSDVEITSPGLANINLGTCVKTVLDIEHPFDTELIGGSLRINSNPSADLRLWIVGAPDIDAAYGGSKEFASGVNLKFLAPDNSFEIDGRVTKYITYDNTTHSGKIRLIFKHPAGLTVNVQSIIHLYRS